MKKLFAATLASIFLASPPALAAQTQVDARAIIKQVETQYTGKASHAVMQMTVSNPSWTRHMTLEIWSQGRDKFLARILSPKKDAGTGTLKIGNDLWNYLPSIDRLMKIPPSLLGDRWMGSDLTNDDLVKEYKNDQLYNFATKAAPHHTVLITAYAKLDVPVVWDKIVYLVDTVRKVPLRVQYFDDDGALVRVIDFADFQQVDGHWIPMHMKVQPMDQSGEYTEIDYRKIDLNPHLAPDFFSLRTLRK